MNEQHPVSATAVDDAEWMGDGIPSPDLAELMAAYVASYPDMQSPLPDDAKGAADWINEGRDSYGCR